MSGLHADIQDRALVAATVYLARTFRLPSTAEGVDEFRHEVLALIRGLTELGATVMSVSEYIVNHPDDELQFLADGVISLDAKSKHRTVTITKLRGSGFQHGHHTVRLTDHGMVVYPKLVPDRHTQPFTGEQLSFGVPEINELLHGGLERGTTTIVRDEVDGQGATAVLVDEVASVTGDFVASQHGLSYLADTVLFLRYLEVQGRVGKVIGVLKKRTSGFENTLREFEITSYGLKVGNPMHHLRGVLSGTPEISETTL